MTIPGNLPAKFVPFLCPDSIKNEVEPLFKERKIYLKDNVYDFEKWIIKAPRRGFLSTPDTHLYRIRKAEKIRAYIQKNGLEEHIAVPKKYLYYKKDEQRYYVVAEKLDLSAEIVGIESSLLEEDLKSTTEPGQLEALRRGAKKRSLTSIQAKALAELSILGYTDLTYNNMYFTKDGKVALLDTEPQKRLFKKTLQSSFICRWLIDKKSILSRQSIIGFAKLKMWTDEFSALKAVQKVERNHVIWALTQLVTKIAIFSLVIYSIPAIGIITTALKIGLSLKIAALAFNTLDVICFYRWSYQGVQGLNRMTYREINGTI